MAGDRDIRKWLRISEYQWDRYEESKFTAALVAAVQPAFDLAYQIRQTRLAFDLLQYAGPASSGLDDFGKQINELRDLVADEIRGKTAKQLIDTLARQAPALQELLSRFLDAEGRSCLALGHEMEPARQASFCGFVTHQLPAPEVWQRTANTVETIWTNYLRLAKPEMTDILKDIRMAGKPTERLRDAASTASDRILAAHIEDIAGRIDDARRVRTGTYLGEVQRADLNTSKFVVDVLASQDHQLRSVRIDQDAKRPVIYIARLEDPVILQALSPYMVRDVRGRYSYRTYRFGPDDAILYDGWMIARYQSLLDEISEGKIMKKQESKKAGTERTALSLRCTFTTGARLDRAFMDYLRSLEAIKIGPNTFDIPCHDSEEFDRLKVTLKADWGYPYCYQSVETPSRLLQTVNDVGSDGMMRFYSVRVLPFERNAIAVKETHFGREAWVLRSPNPGSNWCGGWFKTETEALDHLAAIQAAQEDVDVEALAGVHKRLAGLLEASGKTVTAIQALHDDTKILAHLVFTSEPTPQPDMGAWMPSPRVGSVIQNERTYRVTRVLKEARGWFEAVSDGQLYVALRPDLRGRGAFVTAEAYKDIAGKAAMGPVTAIDVTAGDFFEVPSLVVLMEPGATEGTILDADRYAASPMGGTENWSPYFPSGFTPTGWDGGPKVLYYPTPQHGLLPTWDNDHYEHLPVDLHQDQTVQRLFLSPERRPIQLYPDGVGQHPPMDLQPGEHPPTSHQLGLQPGDDVRKPIPYDPFLIVMPPRG